MNIMCLYWVGKFRGRDFSVDDVVRLHQTVDKHIDRPYRFYCLTNDMEAKIPAEKIPLKHNWPGWWSKIELHRSDLPEGRTLYLDLDTYVVNNLQPILDYPGNLVMFRTCARGFRGFEAKTILHYQAATMLFTPGSTTEVYDKFRRNARSNMLRYRSDQDVMGAWIPDQPVFPNGWMIKLNTLRHVSENELSKDIIIVTGQPGDVSFRDPECASWLKRRAYGKEEQLCM